jgi:2-(3-amino-3-carboxypropyl)histidine synthase
MINRAKSAKVFGIVLGTLGHQGNTSILQRLKTMLIKKKKLPINFLMSELFPQKLKLITQVEVSLLLLSCFLGFMNLLLQVWIQIACPRLSIDWGLEYDKVECFIICRIFLLFLFRIFLLF